MKTDTARHVLLYGITPGERVHLGEGFYYRGFRVSLAAIAILCVAATGLSLLNSRGAWPGTLLVCATAGGEAMWVRWRRAERGYVFMRNHRYVPALAGVLLATLALWPAVDPNALYFPAMAAIALALCVAQQRREIVASVVSVALGSLISGFTSNALPSLRTSGEYLPSTLGVLVVGGLLALLVEFLARMAMLEPATEQQLAAGLRGSRLAVKDGSASIINDHDRRAELLIPAGGPLSERTPQDGLPELLRRASERARLRADGYTGREVQVFFLMHQGFSQTEAAGYLQITPNTVHKTTAAVRRRRQLSTTNDVIEELRQLGYLPPVRLLAGAAQSPAVLPASPSKGVSI